MQGFNMGRYVPPDQEGVLSFNQASGKGHALGSRARKLGTRGILTVRFEMPFAIWCNTCPKPTIIGQGVRFNAEKRKVGAYLSTPIYSFRLKHAACGGAIEIKTDPQNTAYVVVEGAKKRDHGEEKVREGEEGLLMLSAEEREKRREDAFSVLEGKVQEKVVEKETRRRIDELRDARERDWEDPYEASKRIRRGFRVERGARVREGKIAEEIKDRMGLGLELLPESQDDRRRAAAVEFGDSCDGTGRAVAKPLFITAGTPSRGKTTPAASKSRKIVLDPEQKRREFQRQLQGNTRAARDPFNSDKGIVPPPKPSIVGLKRKAVAPASSIDTPLPPDVRDDIGRESESAARPALVTYDSD